MESHAEAEGEGEVSGPSEPMTPQEFAEKMKACESDDLEAQHVLADDLMCELLESLGYEAGVGVFREMDKWYA